jgi:hypothetical protein
VTPEEKHELSRERYAVSHKAEWERMRKTYLGRYEWNAKQSAEKLEREKAKGVAPSTYKYLEDEITKAQAGIRQWSGMEYRAESAERDRLEDIQQAVDDGDITADEAEEIRRS